MSTGTTTVFPPSPLDCAVCNHTGPASCPGCGGLNGAISWGPCTVCRSKLGWFTVLVSSGLDGGGTLLVG